MIAVYQQQTIKQNSLVLQMDEELEKQRDAMLARANNAVDKVADEFVSGLSGRVGALGKAIQNNERETAAGIAYNLETEASTFGWPRVTRICKWLRKILSGEYDQKPEPEDVLQVLTTLKLMVADANNPDEQRDAELFKKIYPALNKTISDI
tara:strand:- start:162607 stop:163062 length:456 start_codon:yes stop_codon:yes gene_type:complete